VYVCGDGVVSIHVVYIIVMANVWELAERRTAVLVHPVLSLIPPA